MCLQCRTIVTDAHLFASDAILLMAYTKARLQALDARFQALPGGNSPQQFAFEGVLWLPMAGVSLRVPLWTLRGIKVSTSFRA